MQTETFTLEKAQPQHADAIWEILQQAIENRRLDGSTQWQDGYPNPASIKNDLENDWAYVVTANNEVVAYAAIIFDKEPAYEAIEGKWLSNGDYVVVHRVAVANTVKGKGVAVELFKQIETLAKSKNVFSIKVDTNFDNAPMLHILNKLGYTYCGEVYFRGAPRKAYEKLLS